MSYFINSGSDVLPLFFKYLKKRKWNINGAKYIFEDAKVENNQLYFVIDCVLPSPDYSYVKIKFETDLENILLETLEFFGLLSKGGLATIIGRSNVIFLVNGKECDDVFISESIFQKVDKFLSYHKSFEISLPYENSENIKLGADCSLSCEFRQPIVMGDGDIYFDVDCDLSDIFLQNYLEVKVNSEKGAEVRNLIQECSNESDFSLDIGDIIYRIVSPELGSSGEYDFNVVSNIFITKLDGVDYGHSEKYFGDNVNKRTLKTLFIKK